MGRQPWSNRKTVEESRALSIARLAKDGVFKAGVTSLLRYWQATLGNAAGQEVAMIKYRLINQPHGGLAMEFNYPETDPLTGKERELEGVLEITTIPSPHGQGKRYFFLCPVIRNGVPCGRRVGKLYLPPGAQGFGCRVCHDLTYRSVKEHDKRVDALRRSPEELKRALDSPDNMEHFRGIKAGLGILGKIEKLKR